MGEQKAAGVVGKAEQLLRQGKTTARAALEDAQAAARKKIREAKIEHADKEHKTEQYYAKQVAEAEQREHQAKEAAAEARRAALQAEHEAQTSAEQNTQKVVAQIAQRSKDDIKNAFIEAHKDKHSALAEAVAKQQDSEKKLHAAIESLDRAMAESEGARSRARHAKLVATAGIEKTTKLLQARVSERASLERKTKEVQLELDHDK